MEKEKKKKAKDVINPMEQEVEKLNKEIEDLKSQLDTLKNDYAKAYADT